MQSVTVNNRGFILLAALVIVSLASVFAVASIRASQQLLRFAQLKQAISTEQSQQLTESVAEFSTTDSSKLILDSATRRFGLLNKSYQRIFNITAKHNDFPLLFDWSTLAELPGIQCHSIEENLSNPFTAATTCTSLPTLNTSVYGNLTLNELNVSLPHSSYSTLLIKGNLKINRLQLSGHNDESVLQIYVLGSAVIETLVVDNPHSTKLLLYSETAQIKITSLATPEVVCGFSDSSSNLKVIGISPHAASINGHTISAEKTAECAAKSATKLKQGLIITSG